MACRVLDHALMKLSRYLFALLTACGTQDAPHPDAGGCGTYDLGPANAVSTPAAPLTMADCTTLCTDRGCPTGFCSVTLDTKGDQILACTQEHTGRRPPGLVTPVARGRCACAAGRFFAGAAHLEAASVPAFRRVAEELAAFGAPKHLSRAAHRSAREEIRHAELMTRLAARCGARVPALVVRARPARTLEAFALDNAIEGCVKETYGAAIALHQSEHASSAEVRVALREIARDEVRHAELAWQIDAWARGRLGARARGRVASTMARAADRLAAREARVPHSALATALGMPTGATRRVLVSSLSNALWRA